MSVLGSPCPLGCDMQNPEPGRAVFGQMFCSDEACPMAQALKRVTESGHVVRFGEEGFTIRHPEACSDDLMACGLHDFCLLSDRTGRDTGLYQVRQQGGMWVFTKIDVVMTGEGQ